MKTLFSLGFQPYNPFSVRHPSLAQAPSLGRRQTLGEVLDEGARAKLQAIITKGNQKLAQVNAWIEAQYAKDPTLLATFKEQYIVDNWRGYQELIDKDGYYADLAAQKIASPDPINYDFNEETISRVEEWNQVIDIMYSAMQEYGGVAAQPIKIKTGPSITTTTTTATGAPVQTRITPGATITTKPPEEGISTKTLLIGGGVAAALIGLVLALKS